MASDSSLRIQGVADVLEKARKNACDAMRTRLEERKHMGRNELSDEEIESLARIAGVIARAECIEVLKKCITQESD